MAEQQRRFLDLWIVEANTVYREVPYTVVADWIQQGRLVEDDMYRPSGRAEWMRIGGSPEWQPYLPKPEPMRVNDQAEALEPVELDFSWKRRHDEEDDDVDMIPLIDISLVLLIFFMMTTAVASGFIRTPSAEMGEVVKGNEGVRIDIDRDRDGKLSYAVGIGTNPAAEEDRDLHSLKDLLTRVKAVLERQPRQVEVTINADRDLESGPIRDLMASLQARPYRNHIVQIYAGVSEKVP